MLSEIVFMRSLQPIRTAANPVVTTARRDRRRLGSVKSRRTCRTGLRRLLCAMLQLVVGTTVGFASLASAPATSIAQTSRSDQFRLENIDPSLIERFRQRQTGPGRTSQDVTSPLDAVRPLEDGTLFQPLILPSEEPSRLELDYADRLSLQAPDLVDQADLRVPDGRVPDRRVLDRRVPDRQAPDGAPPMLEQFGYRMLESLTVAGHMVGTGAINDSYRLGVGDELVVTFRGQTNQSYRTTIDREGQVVLPEMPPVPAAGRSFGHFRSVLQQVTSATFLQTEVFVSLGNVRNFPVAVLGQVNRPGMHRVTGVASVLDAIVTAGGIQKTGSLRRIRVIRGTEVIPVDLYELLLTGMLSEETVLMEGDRVFVPPIGPTIAIAGDVQRPGIYELASGNSYLTVSYALDLVGGTLRPEGYRYLKISTERDGGDQISEVTRLGDSGIRFSDILLVQKAGYSWDGAFFLDGNVSVPGPRALRFDRTVGNVVSAPDVLMGDPYLLFAAVETSDSATKARHFQPIDLGRIIEGRSDVPLKPDDRLIIFAAEDIRFLSSQSVQAILEGGEAGGAVIRPQAQLGQRVAQLQGQEIIPRDPRTTPGAERPTFRSQQTTPLAQDEDLAAEEPRVCNGLRALATVVSRSRSERYSNARLAVNPEKQEIIPTGETCPKVFDRYPNLLPFVLDYVVAVSGEVRVPGIYPVAPGTSLGSLVAVVGGLSPEADLAQIELTTFAKAETLDGPPFRRQTIDARTTSLLEVALTPGDIVQFSPKFSERDTGGILLTGEFKRPGVYTIRRGERLSEVMARAGGITDQAYPLGAVFTRVSVRRREAEAFKRTAVDLRSGLAEALASGRAAEQGNPQAVVLAVRELAASLESAEAVGRVVVEADPTVLEVRKEFDTVLEPGDRLHMPKRPNSVTVSGEVLNPGTIQFVAGKTVDQYIDNAGGVSRVSDDGRTFVVLPNGEAQAVAVSSWNFQALHIPPGSTIVVPRDPKPFDLLTFSISIADILSKLAITAASIAVIGN